MATDSSHRVIMGNTVSFIGCFSSDPFHIKLAGNNDMHESLQELEIRSDWTTDCGVSCLLASEKIPIDL